MDPYVSIVPSKARTKVVMRLGPDVILKGSLPALAGLRRTRAVTTLLEALSLWMDERVFVALDAAEQEAAFCCGLTDEFGIGVHSVFYAVQVVRPGFSRRGKRIHGVADFGGGQLRLVPRGEP